MRVLLIAHVGETVGHLAKALAVADAFSERGTSVTIGASGKGQWLVDLWHQRHRFYPMRWSWSHNSCSLDQNGDSFWATVCASVADVDALLHKVEPDVIIGFPGLATAQIARHHGIAHISVLHGPYLSPMLTDYDFDDVELAVIRLGTRACLGPAEECFEVLSRRFGYPRMDYHEYLQTEHILVAQPGLTNGEYDNIQEIGFVKSSFGPPFDASVDLGDTCYVSFGSGNPCNLSAIVDAAAQVFDSVLVTSGREQLPQALPNVTVRSFIASASLAGRVGWVVCHGGIGTVGVFAEARTPLLVIPTELDQATMAVHARQLGLGTSCGLSSWLKRSTLGRRLPELPEDALLLSLQALRHTQSSAAVSASGASDIADRCLSGFTCSCSA